MRTSEQKRNGNWYLWKVWVKTLSSKLVITSYHEGLASVTFSDRHPVDICLEQPEAGYQVGDIYIGRVQNVVKNIRCAFLDL